MSFAETQCLIAYEKLKFDARLLKFQFSLQYKETCNSLREKLHMLDLAQYFPTMKKAQACINSIKRKYMSILKDCYKIIKFKDLKLNEDIKTITEYRFRRSSCRFRYIRRSK